MQAKTVANVVPVLGSWSAGQEHCFETDCTDYDQYKVLPHAAELEGRVYVKTGWNSDRGRAYYKTGRQFATGL
jgi:hypothetical protein